jgi:hypothetical protein
MDCQTLERYDENGLPVYKSKNRFDTQEQAIEFAKFVNSQDHVIHKVVPYRCKVCNKYRYRGVKRTTLTKQID